jgi:hypothetical protein
MQHESTKSVPSQNRKKTLLLISAGAFFLCFFFMGITLLISQNTLSTGTLKSAIATTMFCSLWMRNFGLVNKPQHDFDFSKTDKVLGIALAGVLLVNFFEYVFLHSLLWSWMIWGFCLFYFVRAVWQGRALVVQEQNKRPFKVR